MSGSQETHESSRLETEIQAGSERSFGIVFAVAFAIVGTLPLWSGGAVRVWALVVAVLFMITAFTAPKLLRPLNLLWFRFGLLLHAVVNPLVMGLLFFLTVTPIALIMRWMGKDPLHRSFDANARSYWVERDSSELTPDTMRRQF
jgi:hypothetical protein